MKNRKAIKQRLLIKHTKRNRLSRLKKKKVNKQINNAYVSKVNLLNALVTENLKQGSVGAVPTPTLEA